MKSSFFPFAMHECTQHMLAWHSFYGTVHLIYNYSFIKHGILLKTKRWRQQRINAIQYCASIISEAWSSLSEAVIIYNLFPTTRFSNNLPTGHIFTRRPFLLMFGRSLDLHLVLSYDTREWTLWEVAAPSVYCKWVYVTTGFKEEKDFSEWETLVCCLGNAV